MLIARLIRSRHLLLQTARNQWSSITPCTVAIHCTHSNQQHSNYTQHAYSTWYVYTSDEWQVRIYTHLKFGKSQYLVISRWRSWTKRQRRRAIKMVPYTKQAIPLKAGCACGCGSVWGEGISLKTSCRVCVCVCTCQRVDVGGWMCGRVHVGDWMWDSRCGRVD